MQDYLDLIPETPEDFDANNAEHVKAIPAPDLTVDEIQNLISKKLYFELTGNNDETAENKITAECIGRAKTLTANLLHLVGVLFTLYSKTQRLIVSHLTIYELYLYNGDTTGAEKWLEKARDIISTRYKDIQKAKDERVPLAAITKRKN